MEISLSRSIVFQPDLLARAEDPTVREILDRERALFAARRDGIDNQIALLRKQIGQAVAEAAALSGQIDAEQRALALQADELAANRDLLRKNFVQKTRVLTLERAVADYEARVGEHKAELEKTRQRATDQ